MRNFRPSLGCVMLMLILAGCARLPVTHYYVLEPSDLTPQAGTARGRDVAVDAFVVDPPYDQDRIVYRVGESSAEIGFYPYHRWAAPLARMLPRVVAAELVGTSGLRSIEPAAPGRDYDAHLQGRVLVFEEIDTSEGPRVRIRVTLTLRAEDGRVELWSETLSADAPAAAEDVGEVVARLQTLLAETVRASRPGLEQALLEDGGS